MLHRLCGPPSIPLSFSLATVLPRRDAYRVSFGTTGLGTGHTKHPSFRARTTRVSNPVCSPSFRASGQLWSSAPLSPQVFLPISTHFTATPGIPRTSPTLQHGSFACRLRVEPGGFTGDLPHPTRPLRPIIPNNARPPRITAAAGSKLAGASSTGTVIIVPVERSLRPKGLHPPRGVAASGFPPLRKIPHCCLP